MNPAINILLPGFWQMWHGHTQRGLVWMASIVITGPLIVPPAILWILCLVDACRLDAASRR